MRILVRAVQAVIVAALSVLATVSWDEQSVPGQQVPARPAPVLTLSPAPSRVDIVETDEAIAESTPVWPAVAALAVGTVALLIVLGNFVLLRRNRKAG
jgi:hypothetical protein